MSNKRFYETVRRNLPRVPPNFMFNEDEFAAFDFAICDIKRRAGVRQTLPLMTSNLLSSLRATEVFVYVILAFVRRLSDKATIYII